MTGSQRWPQRRPRWWLIAVATLCAVVPMSCAQDDQGGTPTTVPTGSLEQPPTRISPEQPPTRTSPEQPPTRTLPGELIGSGPAAGEVLGVVGVPFDDVLNLRAAPGADQRIVARLDPLADDIVATGVARQLDHSIWHEVTAEGVTGWANRAFLAWLGGTDDVTAQIIKARGERPSAKTMLDLGRIVANPGVPDQPPSRITVTVAPTAGDLDEVTYDVVGFADDSVLGERLHVFGRPLDNGQGFSLASVERTLLCARGASDDGLCV